MAEIHGRTSKIKRYYWREIAFLTFVRFAERAEAAGLESRDFYSEEGISLQKEVEREVLEEIKRSHERNPKYSFREESQAEVLAKHHIEIVRLDAVFGPKTQEKGVHIFDGEELVSAEEFVSRHYRRRGWGVLFCESRPFHVIFGIYMWPLIQDLADPLGEIRGFGAKRNYPSRSLTRGEHIWTRHPSDFGTKGYAQRRARAIDEHFEFMLPADQGELLRRFDSWIEDSELLRDYLWAHDPDDVARARGIVEILPPGIIVRILRYLVCDYWGRYTGWPDLLVHGGDGFFFAEVKASKDGLSGDQKRWIADNAVELNLPFKLVKINRVTTRSE
jgi:hypothetical protein